MWREGDDDDDDDDEDDDDDSDDYSLKTHRSVSNTD